MTTYHQPRDIIAAWPNAEQFGEDIGLKVYSHGRMMRRRNRIPPAHWDAVIAAAAARGIDGITRDALERVHGVATPEKETTA